MTSKKGEKKVTLFLRTYKQGLDTKIRTSFCTVAQEYASQ